MKIALFLFVSLLATFASANENCPEQASMNAYMDYLMVQMGPWIEDNEYLPFGLPDIEEIFEAKPIIITYTCKLQLWSGSWDRFAGCSRRDNAVMSRANGNIVMNMKWALRDIHYTYNYRVIGMDWDFLSQDGWLEGGVDNFVMHVVFRVDMVNLYIYLDEFEVDHIGSIWHRLHGNVWTDWLSTSVINTMTWIFRGLLENVISVAIKSKIDGFLDNINSAHRNFENVEEVQNFLQQIDYKQFLPMGKP